MPGSLVFRQAAGPGRPRRLPELVGVLPGADWHHPDGPGSTLNGRDRHPVTHVAYEDAEAYAAWAGQGAPTEAEWEYAARGGLDGAMLRVGRRARPEGRPMANTWQGEFPWQNLGCDGYEGTSPVGSFPPNGYGLYDMARQRLGVDGGLLHAQPRRRRLTRRAACRAIRASPRRAATTGAPGEHIPRRVIKGGSHLCAPNYCLRYRPGGAPGRGDRHLDLAYRLSLHRSR